MEERELDRVAHGLAGFVLAADFFPRELGDLLEEMIAGLRAGDDFERDALGGIEADLEAGLELFLAEIGGAQHEGVGEAAFLADAQAAVRQQVLDLRDRAAGLEAEVADDDVGFVQQHARADEELRLRQARIDGAVEFGAAINNKRDVGLGQVEQRADAVGGRGELGHRGVELFDGLARLLIEDFEFLDAAAQVAELGAARGVDRVKLGEQIDELQSGERVEVFVEDRLERGIGAWVGE